MKNKSCCRKGFTLIELLVVVLIIGILAAVALPQYKKSVIKARLTQLTATINALTKGIDLYLLENGYPEDGVVFATDPSPLVIEIPGECDDTHGCRSKVGVVAASVTSGGVSFTYDSSGVSSGNAEWFDNTWFDLDKARGENKWVLSGFESDTDESSAIMCQWLKAQPYIDQDSVAESCE